MGGRRRKNDARGTRHFLRSPLRHVLSTPSFEKLALRRNSYKKLTPCTQMFLEAQLLLQNGTCHILETGFALNSPFRRKLLPYQHCGPGGDYVKSEFDSGVIFGFAHEAYEIARPSGCDN